MRTDSTRISDDALVAVRERIATTYGAEYLPEKPNFYRSKKDAQDAHEAIRPTYLERDPESIKQLPVQGRATRSTSSSGTASWPRR